MNAITIGGFGRSDQPQTMSSREIAELTGKEHKNVIRDIRSMLDELGKDGSDLSHVREDKDIRGYTSAFHLDRELTETLLTGYSATLRRAVIRRWQELESGAASYAIPQSYSEALRLAADNADRADKAEAALVEAQPKLEALDRLETSEGSVGPRLAAKMLDMPEKKFTAWLQQNRWAFRQNGVGPLQAYVDKRDRGYLEHRPHTFRDQVSGEDRTVPQMMITPKGLKRLAELLAKVRT